MSEKPTPEEVTLWQRRLAAQANNRAWSLSEQTSRTPEEDEEMLQAAHAAMYFWMSVGNDSTKAHAVAANVAVARQDAALHREHYRNAKEQAAALPDPEEPAILEATFRALPVP